MKEDIMFSKLSEKEQIIKNIEKEQSIKDIENRFTYHKPKDGQPEKYTKVRDVAKEFALLLNEKCPKSRELSLALTKLEECVFWANASIARN